MGHEVFKRVFIIILNWNGYKDTVECVQSLFKIDYPNYEILVVDNGSSDDSVSRLRAEFPGLTVLANGRNLGFPGGNNVGIRYAMEKGAEYVFLLNNDTVVDSKVLTELVRVAEEDKDVGMVGPVILDYINPSILWFAGSTVDYRMGWTPHWGENEELNGKWSGVYDVDRLSGCAMLIKKEVIQSIGLLDEDYFLYYEDTDWCVRANHAGYKIKCTGSARVWHKVSDNGRRDSPMVRYYCQRNKLLFLKKTARLSIIVHLHNCLIVGLYLVSFAQNIIMPDRPKHITLKARYEGIKDYYSGRFGKKELLR